jgi:hypothetical protein
LANRTRTFADGKEVPTNTINLGQFKSTNSAIVRHSMVGMNSIIFEKQVEWKDKPSDTIMLISLIA